MIMEHRFSIKRNIAVYESHSKARARTMRMYTVAELFAL